MSSDPLEFRNRGLPIPLFNLRLGSTSPVPAPEYLDGLCFMQYSVEYLVSPSHNIAAQHWALPNPRVPFGEEFQRLRRPDNQLTQFPCGSRIFNRNCTNDLLQIVQKRIFKLYFVVQSRIRERTAAPLTPGLSPRSAWRTASSRAASISGVLSSHSLTAGSTPSFSTKAAQELIANRRSSSALSRFNSDSIWAILTWKW